jgi:hypothetical protein
MAGRYDNVAELRTSRGGGLGLEEWLLAHTHEGRTKDHCGEIDHVNKHLDMPLCLLTARPLAFNSMNLFSFASQAL